MSLYKDDFHAWAELTAFLLKNKQFNQIDMDSVIYEIDQLGESVKTTLENKLLDNIFNKMKLEVIKDEIKEYESQKIRCVDHSCFLNESKNKTIAKILLSQLAIKKIFKRSPSLKEFAKNSIEDIYSTTRKIFSYETPKYSEMFSIKCPYKLENEHKDRLDEESFFIL